MRPITAAERRALEAVLRFGTTKQAAAMLGRSPRTIEAQLASLRARLDVGTTIQAAGVLLREKDATPI